MKKHLLALVTGTALLTLSGCAQVTIKDEEICADVGVDGASCVHTLTEETRRIDKLAWDAERFGQICVGAEAIADWKAELEQLCSISNRCTYEQKRLLREAFERVQGLSL